jgi:DNA-binding CsgD family transcriptional regulator/PAS domain-containing protein
MHMGALPKSLDGALGACMDASVEPALWDDALSKLANALNLVGCSLNTNDRASRLMLPATSTYRDMLVDFVADGWQQQDLRAQRGWRLVAAGKVVLAEDMLSTAEERKTLPFYADFLRRHDMTMFTGFGCKIGDTLWSLSGARSARQGLPSPADRALLERTQPHLKRIMRFAQKVAQGNCQSAMMSLAATQQAAICLDRRGKILQMTQAAEALMGQGVSVRSGRLTLDDVPAGHALDDLMKTALDANQPYSATTRLVSAQRDGRRPLVIEVIPSREALGDPLGFLGALVLLHDLDQARVSEVEILRQTFSLSPREAQVAAMIGAGARIDTIAEQLELRRSSVSQLIKAAMAKMGVNSRAELVALLARLPRNHRP